MQMVLSQDLRIGENGNNYCKYVLDTYFESQFDQGLWNHYDTDSETTNNFVEGDNFKMNSHCNSNNPNINKATDMLVQYHAISINKFNNACKPETKAPCLDRLNRDRNLAFRIARQYHRDGDITTVKLILQNIKLVQI